VKGSIPTVPRLVGSEDRDEGRRVIARVGVRSGLQFEEVMILPGNKVSVLADNDSSKARDTEGIRLTIRHPLYKANALLSPTKVPPFSNSWVDGEFEIFDRKIILKAPANLEPELEFIKGSERIDPPNSVSVRIRNKADHAVKSEPKNWIYVPDEGEEEEFQGPSQGTSRPALNCLIYSFLEMEHADFKYEKSEFINQLRKHDYVNPPAHEPKD
jgi:hypothetical protein